jgi:hypothetical protein
MGRRDELLADSTLKLFVAVSGLGELSQITLEHAQT